METKKDGVKKCPSYDHRKTYTYIDIMTGNSKYKTHVLSSYIPWALVPPFF
jgi:hypothetical protein